MRKLSFNLIEANAHPKRSVDQRTSCTGQAGQRGREEVCMGVRVGGMTPGWECPIGTSITAGCHWKEARVCLSCMREGDRFLDDLVEADEVDLEVVWGGCRVMMY